MKKVHIAVAGLRFGEGFLKIYCDHPDVGAVGIFDISKEVSKKMCQKYQIDKVYDSFQELLDDPVIDAVHLVTPVPFHAEQTISVLKAGKHCACTVPMAETIEQIRLIKETAAQTGKKYMMMETSIYTYHSLFVKEMIKNGKIGNIQFMTGNYYQDFSGIGTYWKGLPPMWYATHATGPLVNFAGSPVKSVHCFGTGTMPTELREPYGNPFPVECAILEFENGLKAEVIRTMFETARVYQEGFNIYGSKASFEWGIENDSDPFVTYRIPTSDVPEEERDIYAGDYHMRVESVKLPRYYQTLPQEIRKYTMGQGSGHHGSHPHLVHEFISSILEDREPYINAAMAANITAAGICAHESAMKNGMEIFLPADITHENTKGCGDYGIIET